MELIPDSYYKTSKGVLLKYSFVLKAPNGALKYMFWNLDKQCTVIFSSSELIGLKLDEGSNLIYG